MGLLHSDKTFIHPTQRFSAEVPLYSNKDLFSIPLDLVEDLTRLYNQFLIFGKNMKESELGGALKSIFLSCSFKYCKFFPLEQDKQCKNIGKFYSIYSQQDRIQTECCIHTWGISEDEQKKWCDNCQDFFTNSNRRKGKGDDGIDPPDSGSPPIIPFIVKKVEA